jgi:hypothetical protein
MRKILLLSLVSLPLVAGFFPSTLHTSVASVNGNTVTLSTPFSHQGMSGVVVHAYNHTHTAITARVVQTSHGKAILSDAGVIDHDEIPTINTKIKRGDKVIGGYLYENVLVLAPNEKSYNHTTKRYKKRWVHPDLFALFLSINGEGRATKEMLQRFAKKYQVGLVYIIRQDAEILLDPISGQTIAKKGVEIPSKEAQFPFYHRLGELESGWFGTSESGNYYQAIGAL